MNAKRSLSVLILLIPLFMAQAAVPVRAAGTSNPAPSRLPASLPLGWYDGTIKYSTITNCVSIIQGNPYQEYGAGTYVGFYAYPDAGQPTVNSVYYVHVVLEAIGNACSGQQGYIDIGLPSNTSLAISTTNPVYCFANGAPITPASDCPQALPASTINSGMYEIPPPSPYVTWPLPIGQPWEFQIPVRSTTTLSNNNLQAKVQVLDGNSSPWLNPTEGVYVFAAPPPPLPAAFSKSSPLNGAVKVSSGPTLKWSASTGAASYQYCIDKVNDNLCNTSWVSVGAATSKALSGLAHGVKYFWQVRAVNAGGSRTANSGAWWSFTTLPLPGAFSKTAPLNGATVLTTGPTLKWGASTNAASYQYCIDKVNDNVCNTSWVSVGTATTKVLSGLTHGVKYFWQVRAKNAAGIRNANSGTWWSFKVQ